MSDWQPIGSHPKDGTSFLACDSLGVVLARHIDGVFQAWESDGAEAMSWNGHEWTFEDISHWMPLPELPQVAVAKTSREGAAA